MPSGMGHAGRVRRARVYVSGERHAGSRVFYAPPSRAAVHRRLSSHDRHHSSGITSLTSSAADVDRPSSTIASPAPSSPATTPKHTRTSCHFEPTLHPSTLFAQPPPRSTRAPAVTSSPPCNHQHSSSSGGRSTRIGPPSHAFPTSASWEVSQGGLPSAHRLPNSPSPSPHSTRCASTLTPSALARRCKALGGQVSDKNLAVRRNAARELVGACSVPFPPHSPGDVRTKGTLPRLD